MSCPDLDHMEMGQTLEKIRLLIEYLQRSRNMDLSKYRPGKLEKKVLERIAIRGCGDLEGYLSILEEDLQEAEILEACLLVGHSRFFRDPLTFEYLGSQILTDLALSAE